jgi:hypothetical protein
MACVPQGFLNGAVDSLLSAALWALWTVGRLLHLNTSIGRYPPLGDAE